MDLLSQLLVVGQAQPGASGGLMQMLLMIVPLFAIMYFLMIRPQQKKQREHDAMLQAVKAGDKIMTSSGIFGKVIKVSEKRVFVEVADRVQIEFLLDAIAQVITEEPAEAKK